VHGVHGDGEGAPKKRDSRTRNRERADRRRRDRVLRRAAQLSVGQLQQLLRIAGSESATLTVDGERYELMHENEFTWVLKGLHSGAVEHRVIAPHGTAPTGCTCADSKFRNHECKHMKALGRFM
jgi:hypothetical protein